MIWFCLLVPFLLMAFVLSLDGLEARMFGRAAQTDNDIAEPAPAVSVGAGSAGLHRHRPVRARHRQAPTPTGPRLLARLHSAR